MVQVFKAVRSIVANNGVCHNCCNREINTSVRKLDQKKVTSVNKYLQVKSYQSFFVCVDWRWRCGRSVIYQTTDGQGGQNVAFKGVIRGTR